MGMEQIEHFVLVMMENRSFDHYLGALNLPPENRTDVEGLGRGSLPINRHLNDPDSDPGVPPWPIDDVRLDFLDPRHEFPEVRLQWNADAMDGFVATYERFHQGAAPPAPPDAGPLTGTAPPAPYDIRQMARVVMGHYTRKTLPVLYGLADQFTLCDRWHSSFLGSTHPNRIFANAGSCGDVVTTTWKTVFRHKPEPLWAAWETKRLGTKGITWKAYKLPSDLSMFALWPGFANGRDRNAGSLTDFAADCADDRLPEVAIVEPPYSIADDHPTHDPRRGQQFLGYVVRALVGSPSWKRSALILTYDEHGGFFDHVPPPASPEGAREPLDRLGLRVPTLVVSPFSPRAVVSEPLEHTAILKTIAERWNLPLPAEAGPRLPLVPSLWATCFDFSRKRGKAASSVKLPEARADWRVPVDANGPIRSDLAESLAKATQVHATDELQALFERG